MTFASLQWVESTKASDHAMLELEIHFELNKAQGIKKLKVKNTLLLDQDKDQKNILNIHFPREHYELILFKKGSETSQIEY